MCIVAASTEYMKICTNCNQQPYFCKCELEHISFVGRVYISGDNKQMMIYVPRAHMSKLKAGEHYFFTAEKLDIVNEPIGKSKSL